MRVSEFNHSSSLDRAVILFRSNVQMRKQRLGEFTDLSKGLQLSQDSGQLDLSPMSTVTEPTQAIDFFRSLAILFAASRRDLAIP